MNFQPLHDGLIVEYDEAEAVTKGGIKIPDIGKIHSTEATVIAQGPGKRASNGRLIPMPCKVGDKILVSVSGQPMETPDPQRPRRLITTADILGVAK